MHDIRECSWIKISAFWHILYDSLGFQFWLTSIGVDNGLTPNSNDNPIEEDDWRRIFVSVYLTIIGLDNGLSLVRRQAIIWTNNHLLLIEHLAVNLNGIRIAMKHFP